MTRIVKEKGTIRFISPRFFWDRATTSLYPNRATAIRLGFVGAVAEENDNCEKAGPK
jgi:hypothetical protein